MPIINEEQTERILKDALSNIAEVEEFNAVRFMSYLADESKSYLSHNPVFKGPNCEVRVDILFNRELIQEYIRNLNIISPEKGRLLKKVNEEIDPAVFGILEKALQHYETEDIELAPKHHIGEFLKRLKEGKLSDSMVEDEEWKIRSQSKNLNTMLESFFGLKGICIKEGQSYNFKAEMDNAVVHFNKVYGDVVINSPFDKLFLDTLRNSKSAKKYKFEGEPQELQSLFTHDNRFFSRGRYPHLLKTNERPAYVLVGISSPVQNSLSKKDYKENILEFLDRNPSYTIKGIAQNIDPNYDPSAVIKPLIELVKENKIKFGIKEGIFYFQKIG